MLASSTLVAGMLAVPDVATASPVKPAFQVARIPGSDTYPFTSRVVTSHGAGLRDQLSVRVGAKTYSTPYPGAGQLPPEVHNPGNPFGRQCNAGVWVLVLSRTSLTADDSYLRPTCSAEDAGHLKSLLRTYENPDSLVVLNSLVDDSPHHAPAAQHVDLDDPMTFLGAPAGEFSSVDVATTAFSVIGIPGTNSGAQFALTFRPETQGNATRAAVSGLLVPDVSTLGNRQYSLAHLDDATYDISASGSIVINGRPRPAPVRPQNFKGGYRVLVADRRNLATISDTLYDTHDKLLDLIEMERDLLQVAVERKDSVLVFLVTIGDPTNKTTLPRKLDLADGCHLDRLAFAETCRYKFKDREQIFTVPETRIDGSAPDLEVTLQGGRGGDAYPRSIKGNDEPVALGGGGARVTSVLRVGDLPADQVKPGQTLFVEVGGNGGDSLFLSAGHGAFNGGAPGGSKNAALSYPGAGGGGATDVRTIASKFGVFPGLLDSRLLIAAGGGGAGGSGELHKADGGNGGAAGAPGAPGRTATKGVVPSPGGRAGGMSQDIESPGFNAERGRLADGGHGAEADSRYSNGDRSGGGGGGGGGLYGGSGGGGTNLDTRTGQFGGGGGGGGSSTGTTHPTIERDAEPSASFTFLTPYGPTLGDVLRRFGGTPTLVQAITSGSPRYAMVGSANSGDESSPDAFQVSEASPASASVLVRRKERPTGELQGVLSRGDKDMRYGSVESHQVSPVYDNGEPAGDDAVQNGFFDVLAQRRTGVCLPGGHTACPAPDAEWPFTMTSGPAGQQAAFRALAQQLCPPGDNSGQPTSCQQHPTDIRTTYASSNTAEEAATVGQLALPADHSDYTAADYNAVKAQILLELDDATRVHAQEDAVSAVLSAIPSTVPAAGDAAIRLIDKQFPEVPAEQHEKNELAMVYGFLLELLALFLEGLQIHGAAVLIGWIAASIGFGLEMSEPAEEKKEPDDEWKQEAYHLIATVERELEADAQRENVLFSVVYGNWGRLSNYSTNLKADSTAWDATSKSQSNSLRAGLKSAASLAVYREIIPLRYDAAEFTAPAQRGQICFSVPPSGHSTEWRKDCDFHGTAYRYETNPCSWRLDPCPHADQEQYREIFVAALPADRTKAVDLSSEVLDTLTSLGLFKPDLYLRWPFARRARITAAPTARSRAVRASTAFSAMTWGRYRQQ